MIPKILCTLAISFLALSCEKEMSENPINNPSEPINSNELIIPSDFKFKTSKEINLKIKIISQNTPEKCAIKVYDYYPSAGGNLLYTSFAKNNLSVNIQVPSFAKRLYLVKQEPNGSQTMAIADLEGNSIDYDFGVRKRDSYKTNTSTSPDCAVGCDATYNNHTGNITIYGNNPANTICITGSYSGAITIYKSGVVLRICGNTNASNINLTNGSKLVLTDGASLTVNNLNSSSDITVYNSTLTINNNFSPGGKVINSGTLIAKESLNIDGAGELINNGILNISKNLNSNSKFTNNNIMTIGQSLTVNGSYGLNNCSISINENLTLNSPLTNYGLMDVKNNLTINYGGITTLFNGAMISAKNAVISRSITGSGSTSLVKISNNTTLNWGGSLNGNLEYCDANGIENSYGTVNAPAVFSCNVYIPSTSCNSIGNGIPTIVDSDNDGIADDIDVFPNDSERAGESFYPGSNQFGTLAFEDLWPCKGDYDFNDLVVDFRYRLVTNAQNNIKDIEIDYSVRAIGGSYRNGFGFQFDFAPSAVESVSGNELLINTITNNSNGTEGSQSKAVVIAFEDAFEILNNAGTQTVNTMPNDASVLADTNTLKIILVSTISELPISSFNPFIFIDQDRGKEVHLSGKEPTDLINVNNFNTFEDDSNPSSGRCYVTEGNLPWAIEIANSFQYPIEKEDIVGAYNLFVPWAQSGGSVSQDWYLDLSGYRNNAKVY